MQLPDNHRSGPLQTPGAGGPTRTAVVIYCGLLMALSGFSTDIMLPAFDAIVLDLNASLDLVQQTISVFALFFGISQVFYGPASDRFGRKPAMVAGLAIYLAGSLQATLGGSIETVLVGRALQGFGAGAAPVLARAILRDTHSGTNLARALALAMAIFAIGPIIAPLLGYGSTAGLGWRSTFACTGLLGALLFMFTMFRYRETNQNPDPHALRPGHLWKAVLTVLRNRQSAWFLGCACLAYCALFTFLSNAPRIYSTAFDIRGLGFALLFAATGFGIVLGQIVNRAFLPKLGILVILRLASLVLFAASAGIALLSALHFINVFLFTLLMFFFNTSFLVVVSNSAALCLDPHPKIAGLASAFFGCMTNTTGAIFIAATVTISGLGIIPWSIVMAITTGLGCIGLWSVRPRQLEFTGGR